MLLDAFCKQQQYRRLQRSGKLEQISGHSRGTNMQMVQGICTHHDLLTRSKYANFKFKLQNRFFETTDWRRKIEHLKLWKLRR
jgi:hypothetical protein